MFFGKIITQNVFPADHVADSYGSTSRRERGIEQAKPMTGGVSTALTIPSDRLVMRALEDALKTLFISRWDQSLSSLFPL